VAGDGLVHAIVDHFLDEMVRAVGLGVHARTAAHRLEAGQDFNGGGIVYSARDGK